MSARISVRGLSWCIDDTTTGDIVAAFQIEDQARIGFWDAPIIAVAARSGARRRTHRFSVLIRNNLAELVAQNRASWNRMTSWLGLVSALRLAVSQPVG